MKKQIYYLLIAIICITALFFVPESSSIVIGILGGILSGIIFIFIDDTIKNHDSLLTYWYAIFILRKKKVRVSVSSLFRIKLENEYLLILSTRRLNQFQPVGGVFKRLPESAEIFNKLGVLDDNLLPIDNDNIGDLRIRIEANNLPKLLQWYHSQKGRECSPWREFYEELVSPNYLSRSLFPYIQYRHIKTHKTKIRWSNKINMHQLYIAEIYEPIFTLEQEEALKKLKEKCDSGNFKDLKWVKESLILSDGVELGKFQGLNISDSAKWIL